MRSPRPDQTTIARRLLADRRGSMAVEFAIASSIALALIFAAIDVGRLFIVSGLLNASLRQISRENQVRLEPYTSDEFNVAAAVTIAARAAGMLDPNLVAIATTVYTDFDALADGTADASAPPGGRAAQIVKYRLSYTMDYYTPFVGILMDSANFSHVAEIIVYNEPETSL